MTASRKRRTRVSLSSLRLTPSSEVCRNDHLRHAGRGEVAPRRSAPLFFAPRNFGIPSRGQGPWLPRGWEHPSISSHDLLLSRDSAQSRPCLGSPVRSSRFHHTRDQQSARMSKMVRDCPCLPLTHCAILMSHFQVRLCDNAKYHVARQDDPDHNSAKERNEFCRTESERT